MHLSCCSALLRDAAGTNGLSTSMQSRWQHASSALADRLSLVAEVCLVGFYASSVTVRYTACRVLELERLRIADLRDNQEIHERLEAETEVSWGLREALAERRLDAQQQE